jgi:acid phosphatase (class A)
MSLINKVAAIIDSKADLDKVGYLQNKVNYDDEISILNIELTSILPPPPKNSSLTTKREVEEIARATKNRTRKELDLVYLVDNEPLDLFTNILAMHGIKFPKDVFDFYYNVLEQYVYALKFYHNRARPEQLAPYFNLEIDVLYTETHHTPAYPSGHTMYTELAAHMLSDLYTELRKEFFQLSDYCGLARILQGVHYPSDNKASKIAVSKLYPLIKERYNEKSQNFPFDIKPKT